MIVLNAGCVPFLLEKGASRTTLFIVDCYLIFPYITIKTTQITLKQRIEYMFNRSSVDPLSPNFIMCFPFKLPACNIFSEV